MTRGLWIAAVFFAAWIGAVDAATLPLPTVSFLGEGTLCVVVDGKEECSSNTIAYTPERFKLESGAASERQAMLCDVVKKTCTSVDYAEKTYASGPCDPKSQDLGVSFLPLPADYVRVAEEAVNGTPTVKYRASLKSDGTNTDMLIWIGADGIVRRMHSTTTGIPNIKNVVTKFDVTTLVFAPVEPKALELAIPDGFKKEDQ